MKNKKCLKKSMKTNDIIINEFITKDINQRKLLVNEKLINVIIALESNNRIKVERIK